LFDLSSVIQYSRARFVNVASSKLDVFRRELT
jgi:hypothetical protein